MEMVETREFSEWLDRLERDQEIQNEQIGELTKNVSALTATVGTVVEQQRGLFGRANRPTPWGAIIGGVTLLGIMAGLLIAPIQKTMDRQYDRDVIAIEHELESAKLMAKNAADIEWLKRMEARVNDRIHARFAK